MLPHPPEYILEKACCARIRRQCAVLQGVSLAAVFVKSEKKSKKDADGKKKPEQPIPGQPPLAGGSPKHNSDNIRESQGIRSGEKHLADSAAHHGTDIGTQAQMKKQISQGRQNKSDFFPYRTHTMKNSIACVFPETLPAERFLLPLVQVFGHIVHMQTVENTPPEQRTATAFIERCRQQGRLRTFTPVPLGDQRERFLALVQDIRRRGDAYISQLSMVALAGLGRQNSPDPSHMILSSLLHGTDIREHKQTESILWQSRLLIELGELYDVEQAELNNALHTIAQRQERLFAELCEEEENPFALPVTGQNDGPKTDTILRHRLKAWTRLCFHDGAPAPGLLVTRHQAAVELLREVYERRWRQDARLLASLEIPLPVSVQAADADNPPEQACPVLDRLLTEIAADGSCLRLQEESEAFVQAGLREWSQVAATGPIPSPPTKPAILDLFYFPQAAPALLFEESFADTVSGRTDGGEEDAGCVVGLLKAD
jgi:hypothetical protein